MREASKLCTHREVPQPLSRCIRRRNAESTIGDGEGKGADEDLEEKEEAISEVAYDTLESRTDNAT